MISRAKYWNLKCRSNLLTFTCYFFQKQYDKPFLKGAHHRLICEKIHNVIDGKCKRLIINIAPRYGKTELAVKSFIAYGLAYNPKAQFLHLSYSASLATDNSMAIKRIVDSAEYRKLFPKTIIGDKNTQNYWNTTAGGGVYATSTLGQVTGFGAGLVEKEGEQNLFGGAIIIDDPIKPEDALSDVEREKVNQRFETTIRSRVNSRNTPIVIIMQRLHPHDLCGYLQNIEGDEWEVLSLPCITTDADGNRQPLWAEKHTLEELDKIRQANSFVFETQYMQNPRPQEGLMYEQGFKTYQFLPMDGAGKVKAYIDTADTGADYLCCIVYLEHWQGIYVLDVLFTQKPMEYTEPATALMLTRNKVEVAQIESNNGGRGFARNVEFELRKLGNLKTRVNWFSQNKNKDVRINIHSAEVQNFCKFPVGWDKMFPEFYSQLTGYMRTGRNAHDDAPDALTGCVEYYNHGQNKNLVEMFGG